MRLSGVHVASAQGIEDSASCGTMQTHCWNVFLVTLVSADMGAQWMCREIGARGGCEGIGILPSGRPLPLLSGEASSSSFCAIELAAIVDVVVVVVEVVGPVDVDSAMIRALLVSALLLLTVRMTVYTYCVECVCVLLSTSVHL